MMNKFLCVIVALVVAFVPIVSQAHDRDDRHERVERDNRGRLSVVEVIALGLGIGIFGSNIGNGTSARRLERRLPTTIDPFGDIDPDNIYRPRCLREQVVLSDRLGRLQRTFRYRCNR